MNLVTQEAMASDDVTNMAPTHERTHAVSVTNPGVVNTDSNKTQENGQTNAETGCCGK